MAVFGLNRRWHLGMLLGLVAGWTVAPPRYAAASAPDVAKASTPLAGPAGQAPESDPPPSKEIVPPGKGGPPRGQGVLPPLGPDLDDGPPRFFETRPQDRERIRRFLEEHFPELARELRMIESHNPQVFRRRIRQIMPRIVRLMQELERDEELGHLGIEEERLEFGIHRAVRLYFEAPNEEERQGRREKVERLIAEQFDVRQQRGERTIQNLERRLQRLMRQLERRSRSREEVISREIELRLSPEEPLGHRPMWGKRSGPGKSPRDRRAQ